MPKIHQLVLVEIPRSAQKIIFLERSKEIK